MCGGTPYYLNLWNSERTFRENLLELVCTEQGILLNEGDLVLATEDFAGGRRERTPEQVLRAIASGRTKFSEIKDVIGTDPTRPLTALRDLDLIHRIQPIRAKPDASGSPPEKMRRRPPPIADVSAVANAGNNEGMNCAIVMPCCLQ